MVYAALITPREPDLLPYLGIIARSGVDGLVLFGTSGEFIHYDVAERNRLVSLAAPNCPLPLIVNVSHSSLTGAIQLAENAIASSVAGILLMPPYFFHYSDDQVFAFYEHFAKHIAGRIPIYLYNMPYFTHRLSASLLDRLMSTGAFAGIKDSGGEWRVFKSLKRLKAKLPFQNLVGNDRVYVRARKAGADGIISGVAGALPELVVALDRAIQRHDKTRIKILDTHLQRLLKYLSKFPAPIATRHAALARGWQMENPALTFDDATNTALTQFRIWFQQYLPYVLADAK